MRTTTTSGRSVRISRSRAIPSMPAMRTSAKTTSVGRWPRAASAAGASAAVSTACPTLRRKVARCSRMFRSSSTTRMVAISVGASAARKLEREAAPAPHVALEVDAATVRLHDVAHDGEPEAGRARLGAVGPLDEALEDPLALLGRDAGAGVAHRYQDGAVLRRGLHPHPATARRVAERVRDQVGERPAELGRIARDGDAAGGGR